MFELLFRSPASIFHKGQFVFLTPWPVWALAIAILAAAGAPLLARAPQSRNALRSCTPVAIWLLESGLIALILFLLWHPALSIATLRPQQNVVAVLVDDSRSMSIADSSGTREARQRPSSTRNAPSLSNRFQVRMYEFGRAPARIQRPDQLTPPPRNPHRRKLETHAGRIVLDAAGRDHHFDRRRGHAGGIDLDTVAAIRRQHIPINTIGFGQEHPAKTLKSRTSCARARPAGIGFTAPVTSGARDSGSERKFTVRENGKVLVFPDEMIERGERDFRGKPSFSTAARRANTFQISVEPVAGKAKQEQRVVRVVNVESAKTRILYFQGEPGWEYKSIRRSIYDYRRHRAGERGAHHAEQNVSPGHVDADPKELKDGFPAKPEGLFTFQGLIIGSVEASYFTAAQQQLIHDFVDRRGGGLLFLGGRASLSDGGCQASPLAELVPTCCPGKGTFHRDFTGQELTARERRAALPPGRRPGAQRRTLEEDAADGQLPGCRRAQAGRHHAAGSTPAGKRSRRCW